MLLSGNLEISQQSDLESHIEKYLENSFGRNLSNWLQRTDGSLSESKQWLYILIDGINENTNGATLVRRLKTLLARTKGRRVKLIVTCRDVGWEQFSGAFEDSLFCAPLALTQFTDHEWSIVFPRYFAKFDITASLSPEARSALQNPILLRFFCIVHRGETVGEVTRVNLNTVFGKFIERLQQIAHENLGLNGNACLELLFGVVRHMWAQGALNCALAARSLIVTDPASLNAAWVVLKSEGVFLEEPPTPPLKMAKSFRFTYDELMEYVLARSWIEYEDVNNPKALDILIERALMVMPQFSCAVGAILYLDKELGKNGYLVDRAFVLGRDTIVELMASRQVQLLYLCEALSADSAISTTIDQIDRFEQIASPLVRERLAKVIIGILHNQPGNPKIRNIAARMLEANHESVTSTSENAERRFVGPTAEDPQAHELSESAPDKASEIRETARLPDFGEKSESTKPRLPPPSYHYSEATRLEAIAVLIGFGDEEARDVALQGIKAVGSVQLHSALEALRAMDGAADSIVYGSVRHFMGSLIPEYRIFCAWLLRNRYGPEPAALLAALSTDDSQRVYEYTISLFAVRLIEPELIKTSCNHLVRAPKLAVWHQINLIRLITKRPQFQKAELVDFTRIIDAVRPLCGRGHPQVRLEAYRCILSFPECVAPDQILAEVRKDSDRYVRSIAVSYSQRPSD